jgi:hypothetical protein
MRPYIENNQHKKGLVEWLKVPQNPIPKKKKDQTESPR